MDKNLRRAWTEVIDGKELDDHLLDLGQAEVNAKLCKKMLENFSLKKGGELLVHGCGTGQFLDFMPIDIFKNYNTTFADINHKYLKMLQHRLKSDSHSNIKCIIDDAEDTKLNQKFDGILSVLLLEQIDWKKGIDNKVKLKPDYIYIILQEQSSCADTISLSVKPRKTIIEFSRIATPKLVPKDELRNYLRTYGYKLIYSDIVKVPNSKSMVALIYNKRS